MNRTARSRNPRPATRRAITGSRIAPPAPDYCLLLRRRSLDRPKGRHCTGRHPAAPFQIVLKPFRANINHVVLKVRRNEFNKGVRLLIKFVYVYLCRVADSEHVIRMECGNHDQNGVREPRSEWSAGVKLESADQNFNKEQYQNQNLEKD
ncbi:hypothetical protein EVAR_20827_1 [Eumeta japonica]|uniref:Uncharacterized protein n=1 Tax=Eumeta variegata TaxID=151549 RepID=A0A4C1UDE9_EUMVA|nr:hypothetical protein EVAR_20827_1 [Eumeta japonica]